MADAYRDELEATRARKEALEEEVAELRAQEEEIAEREARVAEAEEELKRKAKSAPETAPKAKPKKKKKRSEDHDDDVKRELALARLDREWEREERTYFVDFKRTSRLPTRSDVSMMAVSAALLFPLMLGVGIFAMTTSHSGAASWLTVLPALVAGPLFISRYLSIKQKVEAHERAQREYQAKRDALLSGESSEDEEPRRVRIATD